MKQSTFAIAISGLLSSTSAHLFIQSPPPIAGSGIKQPLDGSGSDFPCHGVSIPTSGGMNMPVGSQQSLVFDGGPTGLNTAVHGGGSCQISITYKTDPSDVKDPANWKVLYSIIGGCPTNSPLNLNEGKSLQCNDTSTNGYDCLNQFKFAIPPEVKNGQATLGWTWFNNVGNREMYMNCVSVDISGGKSDDSGLSTLPSLFVANIAAKGVSDTCKTSERSNVNFPAPGKYVTTKKASYRDTALPAPTDYPIAIPSGCGTAASYGGSGDSGSGNAPAPAPAPAASSAAAPAPAPAPASAPASAPAPAPATTLTKSKSTSTTKKAQIATKSSIVKRPNVTGATSVNLPGATSGTTASAAAPTSKGSGSGSGSCGAGRVSCGSIGSIVCPDASHFGICDYGNCAVSQPVAPGTACINGQITWAAAGKKKAKRHLAKHVYNVGPHRA